MPRPLSQSWWEYEQRQYFRRQLGNADQNVNACTLAPSEPTSRNVPTETGAQIPGNVHPGTVLRSTACAGETRNPQMSVRGAG